MYSRYCDDVLIINGCCIRLCPDPRADIVIRYSSRNMVSLSIDEGILSIQEIIYRDNKALVTLLRAVYRYATLTRAERIICNPQLPLHLIEFIDNTGLLDQAIH